MSKKIELAGKLTLIDGEWTIKEKELGVLRAISLTKHLKELENKRIRIEIKYI